MLVSCDTGVNGGLSHCGLGRNEVDIDRSDLVRATGANFNINGVDYSHSHRVRGGLLHVVLPGIVYNRYCPSHLIEFFTS